MIIMLPGVAIGVRSAAQPAIATTIEHGLDRGAGRLRGGDRDRGRPRAPSRCCSRPARGRRSGRRSRPTGQVGRPEPTASMRTDDDLVGGAAGLDRGRERDERADEHDGLPGDSPVRLRRGDHPGQHHRDRGGEPRDGRRAPVRRRASPTSAARTTHGPGRLRHPTARPGAVRGPGSRPAARRGRGSAGRAPTSARGRRIASPSASSIGPPPRSLPSRWTARMTRSFCRFMPG